MTTQDYKTYDALIGFIRDIDKNKYDKNANEITLIEKMESLKVDDLISVYKISKQECKSEDVKNQTKSVICKEPIEMLKRAKIFETSLGLPYEDIILNNYAYLEMDKRINECVNDLIVSDGLQYVEDDVANIMLQFKYNSFDMDVCMKRAKDKIKELSSVLSDADKEVVQLDIDAKIEGYIKEVKNPESKIHNDLNGHTDEVAQDVAEISKFIGQCLTPSKTKQSTLNDLI